MARFANGKLAVIVKVNSQLCSGVAVKTICYQVVAVSMMLGMVGSVAGQSPHVVSNRAAQVDFAPVKVNIPHSRPIERVVAFTIDDNGVEPLRDLEDSKTDHDDSTADAHGTSAHETAGHGSEHDHGHHGELHPVVIADDGSCRGVCTHPGRPGKPVREMPGDVNRGDCPPYRYTIGDCKRSGNPYCVAPWARCDVTQKYSVGFAGGGSPFARSRPRTTQEGTFGMDYDGLFGQAKNWLGYTRGRHQGGEGAYHTDGEPAMISKAKSLLGRGH